MNIARKRRKGSSYREDLNRILTGDFENPIKTC